MESISSVYSTTNPYQAGHPHHHSGGTKSTDRATTSSAENSDGAKDGSLPISTGNGAIKRLVIAVPYNWE